MSARSSFLRKALDAFERNDSQSLFELGVDLDGKEEEVEGLSPEDNQILKDMDAELLQSRGDRVAAQRLMLGENKDPSADLIVKYLLRLSPAGRERMIAAYMRVMASPEYRITVSRSDGDDDALDAKYSAELLDKLSEIVSKASRLDTLDLGRIPGIAVREYFQQAHSCYLYGFNIGCVVLCRAILEAAFKEVYGSGHTFQEMLQIAADPPEKKPPLDSKRVHWAERIYNAGSLAIHNHRLFMRNYTDDAVEEVLLNARKIVEDLYP
jgi:uncharacterized protein DUF4145